MQKIFLFLLVLTIFPKMSFASLQNPEPGEVISCEKGLVRFFIGDSDLQVGEEVRLNAKGTKLFLRVDKIENKIAQAMSQRVQFNPFGYGFINVGDKVNLNPKVSDTNWMSFNLGANSAAKSGDFGGSHISLGLDIGGYINNQYQWSVMIQADSYGKDSLGTEIRRSAYMLGLGRDFDANVVRLYVGLIDTMTIPAGASSSGITNPYTGQYYNEKIQNDDNYGYALEYSHRFDFKKVNRNSTYGYSWSPRIAYFNAFNRNDYRGYFSLGASLTYTFEDFLK